MTLRVTGYDENFIMAFLISLNLPILITSQNQFVARSWGLPRRINGMDNYEVQDIGLRVRVKKFHFRLVIFLAH